MIYFVPNIPKPYNKLFGLIKVIQNKNLRTITNLGSLMNAFNAVDYTYELEFVDSKSYELNSSQFGSLIRILNSKRKELNKEETENLLMAVMI